MVFFLLLATPLLLAAATLQDADAAAQVRSRFHGCCCCCCCCLACGCSGRRCTHTRCAVPLARSAARAHSPSYSLSLPQRSTFMDPTSSQ